MTHQQKLQRFTQITFERSIAHRYKIQEQNKLKTRQNGTNRIQRNIKQMTNAK